MSNQIHFVTNDIDEDERGHISLYAGTGEPEWPLRVQAKDFDGSSIDFDLDKTECRSLLAFLQEREHLFND